MKTIIVALSLVFTTSVLAQKAKVILLDDHIKSEKLEDNFDIETPQKNEILPDMHMRDSLLGKASPFNQWDELKKDIFYMDLKSKSLSDLEKKYPEVSKNELKKLKEKRK